MMDKRETGPRPEGGHRVTVARYPVKDIMVQHHAFLSGQTVPTFEVDGITYKARVKNIRLSTFAKGTQCVRCGLEGTFFLLQRMSDTADDRAHFNLFGERDGKDVLFTKDHIIPRSQGGANDISNMQTMCEPCNGLKGARPEHKYKVEVLDEQTGHTFAKTFGCDEEHALRAAKALLFDIGLTRDIEWSLSFFEPGDNKWIKVWN